MYHTRNPPTIRLPSAGNSDTNVLLDDRGHPDIQQDYDWLEYDKQAPPLLRKTMHPLPEKVDPEFNVQYDEAIHGDYLREHLKISHLIPDEQKAIIRLVKKYWCVFNPDGLKFPVIGYECYIDTGVNRPVAARKIHYGPRESEIMNKHIAVLLELGHI